MTHCRGLYVKSSQQINDKNDRATNERTTKNKH